MTRLAVHLRPDLAELRLFTPAGEQDWRIAVPPSATPESLDALWWRGQAEAAARWTVERLAGERRIPVACIDTRDASCLWAAAPSDDPRVVAAAIAASGAEWATDELSGVVQPLADPAPARAPSALRRIGRRKADAPATQARRAPVLIIPDALVRLWLDELDRRGVRVGEVVSLWHAAAGAWGGSPVTAPTAPDADPAATGAPAPPPVHAAVLRTPGSLSWCWSAGSRLIAGGTVAVPELLAPPAPAPETGGGIPPAPPRRPDDLDAARSRLTLDWLTWSAQLGLTPERVLVVGPEAATLADLVQKAWPDAACEAREAPDAVAATLQRLGERTAELAGPNADLPLDDDDPRASIPALSRRSGRVHRRLITWTGATMALLAVAVAALGWRARETGRAYRDAAAELAASTRERIAQAVPSLPEDQRSRRGLLSELERLRKQRPEFADPLPAKPILEETGRLARIMGDLGERGLKVVDISLADLYPSANVTVPDFATGEDLANRLRDSGGKVRWTATFEDRQGDILRYRIQGEWEPGS